MSEQMSESILVPIVGMAFRPPAVFIIKSLPHGAPLILEREPENPFDPNAVRVILLRFHSYKEIYNDLKILAIPDHAELSRGQWYEGFLTDYFMLGYVGAKTGHAAEVSTFMDRNGKPTIPATLSSLPTGNPAALMLMSKQKEKE